MQSLRTMTFFAFLGSLLTVPAQALDLDWHGQLRAETNWLWGYSNGLLRPGSADAGYSVFSNGDSPAAFQNLFFDLSPRVIVNDNVSIKSDIWFGTADRGMFGGDQSITSYYDTTRTGNAAITANTFYAEMSTDFGTITVGRAPLNWGLGVVWNYDSSKFYRLPSTGDVIKLSTKLGAFRFSPAVVKYRMGTNYGGSAGPLGTTIEGSSGVSDYSVALSYANDDEQLDLGILFLRRLAGQNAVVQNPYYNPSVAGSGVSGIGYAYNIWDFYAKKRAGIFTLAAEVPLVSGFVAGQDYATVAGAAKVEAQMNERVKLKLDLGMAQGQGNSPSGSAGKLTAFYFHPDYRPGFILFNYNLQNLSDLSSSPYDNPVTNAKYLSLGLNYTGGKWSHEIKGLYAVADKTSDASGGQYFNSRSRHFENMNVAAPAQDSGLGFEVDYLLGYEWDEAMQVGLDLGLFFPGKFYEFSNSATPNTLKTIFGSSVNVRVLF